MHFCEFAVEKEVIVKSCCCADVLKSAYHRFQQEGSEYGSVGFCRCYGSCSFTSNVSVEVDPSTAEEAEKLPRNLHIFHGWLIFNSLATNLCCFDSLMT